MSKQIPYRADIVGSFLRPAALKTAQKQFKAGKIDKNAFLAVENEEVAKLVNKLQILGLKDSTDGEFKRSMWHIDFMANLLGVKETFGPSTTFTATKHIPLRGYSFEVIGKIEYNPNHPFFDSFAHLKSVVPNGVTAKFTIPSPAMFFTYVFGAPLPGYYKDKLDEYINDLVVAYNKTIKHFYDLGCRYLQLDDVMLIIAAGVPSVDVVGPLPSFPPEILAKIASMPDDVVKVINGSIKDLPADLTITLHICRGNYCSDYFGVGAYDAVQNHLAQLNVHGFFLEFDDLRSGTFAPLAKIAANGKNQRVVLGLVTSKRPELEKEADIIARIDEAAKYFPKERLCLSAQCGFASCEEGNSLTEDEQWAKISLIVSIAKTVWGEL